jgi:phosphoribosylpyrophosphate synthetase
LLQPTLCTAEAYDYIKIIGGSSNKALAEEIGNRLGVGAGECKLGRYADGEISISLDEHVRGKVSLALLIINCVGAIELYAVAVLQR